MAVPQGVNDSTWIFCVDIKLGTHCRPALLPFFAINQLPASQYGMLPPLFKTGALSTRRMRHFFAEHFSVRNASAVDDESKA